MLVVMLVSIALGVFLASIAIADLVDNAQSDWADSSLYIVGCTKRADEEQVPKLTENIQLLLSTLNDPSKQGTVILYGDKQSRDLYLSSNESAYIYLPEKFNHKSRTMRIANCRNALLKEVNQMVSFRKEQPSSVFLIVMDLDGVNVKEYNMTVFKAATNLHHEWASISFNRPKYYDFWALRTERINYNIFNSIDPFKAIAVVRNDIKIELRNIINPLGLYPVISAFNGLALYRYQYTIGCTYDGFESRRFFAVEECEHVPFHKCMIAKNNATIMIYKDSLTYNYAIE